MATRFPQVTVKLLESADLRWSIYTGFEVSTRGHLPLRVALVTIGGARNIRGGRWISTETFSTS